MTKNHEDRIDQDGQDLGYTIRVGKTVPSNSVNLAYVHTPEISPSNNLLITDMSGQITENTLGVKAGDTFVFPDDTFLLRELNKPYYAPTKNIVLTDEFSVPKNAQETPAPLYYQSELKGLFDATGAAVAYYPGGYVEKPITDILDYSQISSTLTAGDVLLYLGNKIRVTRLDGTAIESTLRYKVQLIKQTGAGIPVNAYRVVIFTNFQGSTEESYLIRYEKYGLDASHVSDSVEVLNAYPFFSEVSKEEIEDILENRKVNNEWSSSLTDKSYAIVETSDQKWQVYSPSQVIIADNTTRPAHQFSYRIKGRLRTKLDTTHTGSLNIGLVYLNDSVFDAEDLTGALKKIYEHTYKPGYLEFSNPHPPTGTSKEEKSIAYWTTDLSMPSDYLNDYDLIIVTGYGLTDTSIYSDAVRTYLQNGGRLWIDNAGAGANRLSLGRFLTNVSFSTTENSTGPKSYGISTADLGLHSPYSVERSAAERLYLLNKTKIQAGYDGVSPKILFGDGESLSLWTTIVKYQNNDPAVITRTIYDEGTLIISNCGILRSLMNKDSDDIKMTINMILGIAEERYVTTPWIQEYVHHRDNLFKQEYSNGDRSVYIDDRSDIDTTQIVAKKIINKSMRDALIPYMPSSYYKAVGVFKTEVEADSQVVITNSDFEVGSYNASTGLASTTWTSTTALAIPGWNTNLTSGSSTFQHLSNISERGEKAVKITTTSSSVAYWSSNITQLSLGSYRISTWIKTSGVTSSGATLQVRKTDGTILATGNLVIGDRDWTRIEVNFGLTELTDIQIRIGLLTAGQGSVWIDFAEMYSVGSVYMTPDNDGSAALYAYAVKPKGDTFDLKTEGFSSADITIYDPIISFYCIVKSFVYKWDNGLVRYVREYGNYSRKKISIRRSDGIVTIDLLTTLLPDLKAGAEWAKQDKIFFEVAVDPVDTRGENAFVNVAFFNKKTGVYFYSTSGENLIGYSELMEGTSRIEVVIQAWADYYTIRATKRRYATKPQGDERIYLMAPATIDERDPWLPRIHNGSFVKDSLNYAEHDEFSSVYATKQFGTHRYSLPEYDRQIFSPGQPFRKIRKEICEYVDEMTVRVQNAPLYVQQGKASGEIMTKIDGSVAKIFKARVGNWVKEVTPIIYMDSNSNGIFSEYTGEYDIDYEDGRIILENPATGRVSASFTYNNIDVRKRTYSNGRIKRETLKTADKKVFISAHENWLLYPSPVIYRIPEGSTNDMDHIADISTYQINYEEGTIEFLEDVNETVYADYLYSVDRIITVKDYDTQSGLLYLSSPISFKDEIYCSYSYQENFVEYNGYYDEDLKKYIYLDLNPSEGHYCTLPVVRAGGISGTPILSYEEVPTSKLMNKEIYLYLIPYSNSFGDTNPYTIRHCYSKAEWDQVRKTMPGIALLLGVAQIREHTTVNQAIVLDTRVRGGGMKESLSRDFLKKKNPLVVNHWDMGPWDGQAYYSNGVIILNLPNSILKVNGGQFTEQQVIDILKKHVAYGIYCIVEYVNYTTITPPEEVTDGLMDGSFVMDGSITMGG